jgi:parvulin-like peptidyl-prolyl isomerase
MRRVAMVAGVLLLFLLLAIPSYAYYQTFIVPGREAIAQVNQTFFTLDDYMDRLRLKQGEFKATGNTMDFSVTPIQLLYDIVDDELIRQKAREMGISATPEEITEEQLTYSRLGVSGEQYRRIAEAQALRKKLHKQLADQVPVRAEQIRITGILAETEEDAQAARLRWLSGESPADLAQTFSQDESSKRQGGEVGWLPRGIRGTDFDKAAFALPLDQVSNPIQTDKGFWLIVVQERTERVIEPEHLKTLKDNALKVWLEEQKQHNEVRLFWDSDKYARASQLLTR